MSGRALGRAAAPHLRLQVGGAHAEAEAGEQLAHVLVAAREVVRVRGEVCADKAEAGGPQPQRGAWVGGKAS